MPNEITSEQLQIEVLSRRNKRKLYCSRTVADALGATHTTLLQRIRKLEPSEFVNKNFIGRSYTGPDTTQQVYYDISTAGIILLLLKHKKTDEFRMAVVEKLMALL